MGADWWSLLGMILLGVLITNADRVCRFLYRVTQSRGNNDES